MAGKLEEDDVEDDGGYHCWAGESEVGQMRQCKVALLPPALSLYRPVRGLCCDVTPMHDAPWSPRSLSLDRKFHCFLSEWLELA